VLLEPGRCHPSPKWHAKDGRCSNFQWSFPSVKMVCRPLVLLPSTWLLYSTHPCHACTSVSNNHHTCANMCVNSWRTRSPASAITSSCSPQSWRRALQEGKRKHDAPPWYARQMSYQKHCPRLLEAIHIHKACATDGAGVRWLTPA
jgi:hypothetical protein